jgi:hypothetical protein
MVETTNKSANNEENKRIVEKRTRDLQERV